MIITQKKPIEEVMAMVADAKTVVFGLEREVLRCEQCVGSSAQEPQEVIITGFGVAQSAPLRESVYIYAERNVQRCF